MVFDFKKYKLSMTPGPILVYPGSGLIVRGYKDSYGSYVVIKEPSGKTLIEIGTGENGEEKQLRIMKDLDIALQYRPDEHPEYFV